MGEAGRQPVQVSLGLSRRGLMVIWSMREVSNSGPIVAQMRAKVMAELSASTLSLSREGEEFSISKSTVSR